MADKDETAPQESEAGEAKPKKSSPIKIMIIAGALMVLEAGAVAGFFMLTGGGPKEAAAEGIDGLEDDAEAMIEIPLMDAQFQNHQTGRVWVWDTQIVLKVRQRNQERVEREIGNRAAEIQEGIAQIIRRATHNQLKEPGLETINRQIMTYLNEVVPPDVDGLSRIERIIIPKCKGFPADV